MSWKSSKKETKSSKQETVADSTIEVEYIAAFMESKKVVWIKNFITELGVVLSIANPIELYCDNIGAIAQVVDRSRPTRRSDRRSVAGAGTRRRPRRCGGPVTRPVRSRGRRGRCPSPDDDRPSRRRQNDAGATPPGTAAAAVRR